MLILIKIYFFLASQLDIAINGANIYMPEIIDSIPQPNMKSKKSIYLPLLTINIVKYVIKLVSIDNNSSLLNLFLKINLANQKIKVKEI